MKKLRELRKAIKYTQKDLAKLLNVSQQTIARWEMGKAEPNIAALNDIAMIFQTSVDDLLNIEKNKIKKITTNNYYIYAGKNSDGFWGHLGLSLLGYEKTKWYPITLGEANRLGAQLSEYSDYKQNWLVISTLNNRMLVFSLSAMKRICLLNDASDQPNNDDWELAWDGYQGHSAGIYNALEDYFFCPPEEYEEKYSENLRNIVKDLIKEHKIDEDKLDAWVLDTHLHFVDGTSINYGVDNKKLESIVHLVEYEENPRLFDLENLDGTEFYYPATAVRLIDMPLLKYGKGCKETGEYEDEEIEQED